MHKTLLALTVTVQLAASPVIAENIAMIVPYSAGGPTDQVARTLQPAIQDELGDTIIIDNRPGGGGMIGGNALAQAAPDGTTIGLFSIGHILTALTKGEEVPYDAIEDFTPIALVGLLPAVLVTRSDLAANDIDSLFALAQNGDLSFGSSGVGTGSHLGGEMIAKASGA